MRLLCVLVIAVIIALGLSFFAFYEGYFTGFAVSNYKLTLVEGNNFIGLSYSDSFEKLSSLCGSLNSDEIEFVSVSKWNSNAAIWCTHECEGYAGAFPLQDCDLFTGDGISIFVNLKEGFEGTDLSIEGSIPVDEDQINWEIGQNFIGGINKINASTWTEELAKKGITISEISTWNSNAAIWSTYDPSFEVNDFDIDENVSYFLKVTDIIEIPSTEGGETVYVDGFGEGWGFGKKYPNDVVVEPDYNNLEEYTEKMINVTLEENWGGFYFNNSQENIGDGENFTLYIKNLTSIPVENYKITVVDLAGAFKDSWCCLDNLDNSKPYATVSDGGNGWKKVFINVKEFLEYHEGSYDDSCRTECGVTNITGFGFSGFTGKFSLKEVTLNGEYVSCVPGQTETQSCGSDIGECVAGEQTRICTESGWGPWGSCIGESGPIDEICDGKDNDCDGVNDNGNLCSTGERCAGSSGCVDCTDNDGDNYYLEGCGRDEDCNDNNANVNPGVFEQGNMCIDGIDNDCDGFTDGADTGCGAAEENPQLKRVFPSSYLTIHYYCWNCPQSAKDFAEEKASLINFADVPGLTPLIQTTPLEAFVETNSLDEDTIAINYRFIQYVQDLSTNFSQNPSATGLADQALVEEFATANGYNIEDLFLHWSEPTKYSKTINQGTVTVEYDGTNTILTDVNGDRETLKTSRAIAPVWTNFYYVFDWNSEAWYQFIKWRAQQELYRVFQQEDGTTVSFDGYFEDVLLGPITDTYADNSAFEYGGGISEFDGKTPQEINSEKLDYYLINQTQTRLNNDFPGKVFLPNSGNYQQDWALEIMLAGDGTITEMVNSPSSTFWKESWDIAKTLASEKKYYTLASYWEEASIPLVYPSGTFYSSSLERSHLHNAAWYWMAYQPGYVSFSLDGNPGIACCNWIDSWPELMEADIGEPVGDPYLADSGTTSGWNWELYARDYTGSGDGEVTVYFRGNMAWRSGNGESIGYDSAAASFDLPENSELLRMDGTWTDAPDTITHWDSFGFVVREKPIISEDHSVSFLSASIGQAVWAQTSPSLEYLLNEAEIEPNTRFWVGREGISYTFWRDHYNNFNDPTKWHTILSTDCPDGIECHDIIMFKVCTGPCLYWNDNQDDSDRAAVQDLKQFMIDHPDKFFIMWSCLPHCELQYAGGYHDPQITEDFVEYVETELGTVPNAVMFNAWDILAGPDGLLKTEWLRDVTPCDFHPNDAGSAALRDALAPIIIDDALNYFESKDSGSHPQSQQTAPDFGNAVSSIFGNMIKSFLKNIIGIGVSVFAG